jgi:ribosomal protein S18 acetylase RimI-like enzyme
MEINNACYVPPFCAPESTMREMMMVSDIFVVRVDHLVVGIEGIVGFAIVRNVEHPYIWNIAVDPTYQSRGVGGNLLREIIKNYTLNKESQILLHVDATNPAQKLYFDYGFRVVAVEEDYFKPNDGLLMRRVLP